MADKNIFVLDDGTEEIIVRNKFGDEICKLHIRSGDLGIIDRYQKLVNGFDDIVAPLKDMPINNDGSPDGDESDEAFMKRWEIIKNVEKLLIDQIDQIFDMKDGAKLFEKRNAFSTVNGVYYAENVIEMLGKIVTSALEQESLKSKDRMKKYMKDIR